MKRMQWMMIPGALTALVVTSFAIPPGQRKPTIPPLQTEIARIIEVRPNAVFPGDFATAYGFRLDEGQVTELWLVDENKTKFRVEILERTPHSLMFRVPNWIPEGRWQLAILVNYEMLLEQGVYLKVRPFRGFPTG